MELHQFHLDGAASNTSFNASAAALCLLGSLGSHAARFAVCTGSAALNVIVLTALLRSVGGQARGFIVLVALDIFMNLFLALRSLLAAAAAAAAAAGDRSDSLTCLRLQVATSMWRIAYLLRSWWIVAMTWVRYTVVTRPLTASVPFSVRRQTCLLCGLLAASVLFIGTQDAISSALDSSHGYIFDLTIALEVVISSGLPSILVAVLTFAMTVQLVQRSRMWTGMPPQADRNLKATKTLLFICTTFIMLSFPHLLYEAVCSVRAIQGPWAPGDHLPAWLDVLGEIKSLLISADSAMNFAIYFAMCSAFRAQLLSFLGFGRRPGRSDSANRRLSQSAHPTARPRSVRLRQEL